MTRPPLLLVPTALEARPLLGEIELPDGPPQTRRWAGRRASIGLCGVGPVAAAAVTAHWIAQLHPPRVLLVGSAGSYALERAPIGSVVHADAIACDGLGSGEGARHQPLDFPQLPRGFLGTEVHDRIELDDEDTGASRGLVLTTTTVAANADEVRRRLERHPGARVEEMEGFGVALACRLAGVPLRVLRGVSNAAGNRDSSTWDVAGAMRALHPFVDSWLGSEAR